jgi:hypothetical protein
MDEPRAQRTLVKSPPELWAEVSDADALAAHLAEFGEIRITRSEPETTVAWEGDRARGTVQLEPTAWGTKVTLTAEVTDAAPRAAVGEPPSEREPAPVAESATEPVPVPVADPAPELEPVAVADAPARPPAAEAEPARGLLARLFGRRRTPAPAPGIVEPEPVEVVVVAAGPLAPEPAGDAPQPEPPRAAAPTTRLAPDRAREILGTVLDDLGSAHHRPFSR